MDRVGVRELRQNLSVYLRRVGRGESLEVTERGRASLRGAFRFATVKEPWPTFLRRHG